VKGEERKNRKREKGIKKKENGRGETKGDRKKGRRGPPN